MSNVYNKVKKQNKQRSRRIINLNVEMYQSMRINAIKKMNNNILYNPSPIA